MSWTRSRNRSGFRAGCGLLMSLVLLVSGCALFDGSSGGLGQAPLRVGVSPTYPPVIFEEDGEIVGIEAELAQLLGETIGRRIVFERRAFPDLLRALEDGEVDVVMSGLSITPERARRVRFTEPYMQVGQLAVIRARDVGRFGRVQLLRRRGASVGYERGTTGELFVAEQLAWSNAFAFDDLDAGIRSLRAGRIDYFIHDAPTIWRLAGDPEQRDLLGLYHPLTEEHLAWAVRKEDVRLQAVLDATLQHWQREGIIEPVLNRWIRVRVNLH